MPFFLFWLLMLLALGDLVADSLVDVVPHLLVVVWVLRATATAVAADIKDVFEPVGNFLNGCLVGPNGFHSLSLRNWLGVPSLLRDFVGGDLCLSGDFSTLLRIVTV